MPITCLMFHDLGTSLGISTKKPIQLRLKLLKTHDDFAKK